MKSGIFFSLIVAFGLLFSCTNNRQEIKLVDADNFTTSINGKNVNLYTLKSKNGMTMQVTNYGGHVVSLWVPDKNGQFDEHRTRTQHTKRIYRSMKESALSAVS